MMPRHSKDIPSLQNALIVIVLQVTVVRTDTVQHSAKEGPSTFPTVSQAGHFIQRPTTIACVHVPNSGLLLFEAKSGGEYAEIK
jgi:hypothetical protein